MVTEPSKPSLAQAHRLVMVKGTWCVRQVSRIAEST